jgi:hypothetical protein
MVPPMKFGARDRAPPHRPPVREGAASDLGNSVGAPRFELGTCSPPDGSDALAVCGSVSPGPLTLRGTRELPILEAAYGRVEAGDLSLHQLREIADDLELAAPVLAAGLHALAEAEPPYIEVEIGNGRIPLSIPV